MHRKSRIGMILAAFAGVILLGGIGVYCLVYDQSQTSRRRHIDVVLKEVHRGNYFAWAQVWMWMGRLNPREEKELTDACGNYALTNHVLHVTGIAWPPEASSDALRSWSAWLKGGLNVEDKTLAYDTLEFIPAHDIHLNAQEALYRLPMAAAATAPVALNKPSVNPAK